MKRPANLMKYIKYKVVFTILLIAFCINAKAQDGCVIYNADGTYDNRVYTVAMGTTTSCNGYTVQQFFPSSSFPLPADVCLQKPTPDLYRQCVVGTECGVLLKNYKVPCPIDDYVPVLLGGVCIVGFYCLRGTMKS